MIANHRLEKFGFCARRKPLKDFGVGFRYPVIGFQQRHQWVIGRVRDASAGSNQRIHVEVKNNE